MNQTVRKATVKIVHNDALGSLETVTTIQW